MPKWGSANFEHALTCGLDLVKNGHGKPDKPNPLLRRTVTGQSKPMDATAVLFANEAFYYIFSQRDFAAMERLWAQDWPVLCIHPGWPALTEREAIIESWRRILQNPNTPAISPHYAKVLRYGKLATVVCYEEIQGRLLLASNSFVIERNEICIVQHHASHCANPPPPETKSNPAMQ